jgi:hypothetical protein
MCSGSIAIDQNLTITLAKPKIRRRMRLWNIGFALDAGHFLWDLRRPLHERKRAKLVAPKSARPQWQPIYAKAFFTRSSVNGACRNRTPASAIIAFETAGVMSGVAICPTPVG